MINTYEIIGLVGTAIILMSFLAGGEKKIRQINMVGALVSVLYGVLIGAMSVWLLNAALVVIHFRKLMKL